MKKKAITLLFLSIMVLVFVMSCKVSTSGEISLNGEVYINGERIEAPAPYVYEGDDFAVMVPLDAVAEKLGYEVLWNPEDMSVFVGYGIKISIGEDTYRVNDRAPVRIYPAPEIVGNHAFVPLDFFKFVITGYDTYVSDGKVYIEKSSSVVWLEPDNVVTDWYADDSPEDNQSISRDTTIMRVGKTEGGCDIFSFLRLQLKGDWFANEITSAKLFLKAIGENVPEHITIGRITKSWSFDNLSSTQARAIVDASGLASAEINREDNGWVSILVTDMVREWIGGAAPNYGIALFAEETEPYAEFVSGNTPEYVDVPYLLVSGEIGERASSYGRFGFTIQPGQISSPYGDANCLAYALRDNDPIYLESLGADYDEINRINAEHGENEVLEYLSGLVEAYVETHKEGLQISGFRRLGSFDAPIDPEAEYLVALRLRCDNIELTPMGSIRGFDFHVWAQLDDGRWTQKFPSEFSEIIPGTGPGISPGKYIWHSARIWGERYIEYYTSDIAYFAVTKSSDDFTNHLNGASENLE